MNLPSIKNWMWKERHNHLINGMNLNIKSLVDVFMRNKDGHTRLELTKLAIEVDNEHLERMKEYC